MFIKPGKKYEDFRMVDAERGIVLTREGGRREPLSHFFLLTGEGATIPFEAERNLLHPDESSSPLVWTILKVGVGEIRIVENAKASSRGIKYEFSSAEKEKEAVELMKEALKAYRSSFGQGNEVHEVQVADDAWQFKKNNEENSNLR